MLIQFLSWYLIVQLITLAVLPLGQQLFAHLPDRGYAFAKSLGILLVGFTLWLGYSYGLLRNETGGAWLALLIVAGLSWVVARQRSEVRGQRSEVRGQRSEVRGQKSEGGNQESGVRGQGSVRIPNNLLTYFLSNWRYVAGIELLFLLAFAGWAYVRSHDPAANHTEKPMDLMFMNSLWASPTYPPPDAWLSGQAISYYYFGYWLLTTLGRLAGQPPEIAYNLGQACWFGLLLIGCVGVVYNLLRRDQLSEGGALAGGLLAALAVGVTGNLQVVLEWLHATGTNVTALAGWFDVANFPGNAAQTGNWYIGFDWWWWRSSRVIEDLDLLGRHIEVIDEFPIFSYMLGDNHPHVLAMPIVLLVIGLVQNLFFMPRLVMRMSTPAQAVGQSADEAQQPALWTGLRQQLSLAFALLGWSGLLALLVGLGALVFLNTWDFPPYWLLFVLTLFIVLWRTERVGGKAPTTALWPVILTALVVGSGAMVALLALYLPYLLTAQSQAGGFLPNLFNPTRFPQFLLMFGFALCGIGTLLMLGWQEAAPARSTLITCGVIVLGLPLLFLLLTTVLATNTAAGQKILSAMALPDGATSHIPFIWQRWRSQALTFLVVGLLLALTIALIWQRLAKEPENVFPEHSGNATTFALLLAAIGLALVYAPEFIYLRDNFGTRMNTIFKFYYQAWLLFGLSSSYAVMSGFLRQQRTASAPLWAVRGLSTLTLLLIAGGLLFPAAAVYSKTGGFANPQPTFDATAYVAIENPAVTAALAWVRSNTAPDALIAEAKGASYRAEYSRISAVTGRATLLGWDGHESQWRGKQYAVMAQGRAEALDLIYRGGSSEQIVQELAKWGIDYVYYGPTERSEYQLPPGHELRLAAVMDLVFEEGDVRIYRRRS